MAHVLGWFGKAVAIRDWGLLWAYSIAFELCELTFEHWQPNFNECWWDMWVWDVMICNLSGICAGMWLVKFARGKLSRLEREEGVVSIGGGEGAAAVRRCAER